MPHPSKRKESLLTLEQVRGKYLYNPETGEFRWRNDVVVGKGAIRKGQRAGDIAGGVDADGYKRLNFLNGKKYLAHRVAWFYVNGVWPENDIDHINGDRGDNRLCNLRQATNQENVRNGKTRIDNKAGLKGVSISYRGRRWVSKIQINDKQVFLGYFRCPTAAHLAYCKAAKAYFGEFARLE